MQPSSPTHRQTISAILIDAGAVTPEQVALAIERHRETGCRIGEALVQLGFVSEEDIGWALARQLGIP
nr:type II secretion system protein GspE [Candidatus Eisenbacteria bacterium]